MKKKFTSSMGLLMAGLLLIGTIAIAMAVEVGVLLLVDVEFDHWSNLVWFIIIYGVIEFILMMFVDAIIEIKAAAYIEFHKFFAHMILSFIVVMSISMLMEAIYLPDAGAVIFAGITAVLYLLFSFVDNKEGPSEDQ